MDEPESQIAKIALGNTKASNTYIFVMAEKAPAGNEELYVIAELPLLNPSAKEDCERICLAIASTLKRSFRRESSDGTFENAIAAINEELGKLASMGQTQWIDKLNCILGLKKNHFFSLATCGKVSAFLLRSREYTDISCSSNKSHPLKTFGNYATGKIRLGDLLILSTVQLFNYMSMDRLAQICGSVDFPVAAKTVVQLLRESAEPQISFGVLLNLQSPASAIQGAEVDLENYLEEAPASSEGFFPRGLNYVKTMFGINSNRRVPKIGLPKISWQSFSGLGGKARVLLHSGRGWWQNAKNIAATAKAVLNPANLKQMNPVKKLFLISVLVLAIALVFSLSAAIYVKNRASARAQITSSLNSTQSLLTDAQSSLLYKNDARAAELLQQAKNRLPAASAVDSGNKKLYDKVVKELNQTISQIEKTVDSRVENLGNLGDGENLIKLPLSLSIQSGSAVVSYNRQNGKIEDGALKLPLQFVSSVYAKGNSAAVYDGNKLYIWDFAAGTVSEGFAKNLPQKKDFGGMAWYGDKSRVYMVDKKSGTIVSFAAAEKGLGLPVVAARDAVISQAVDIAVDGGIYVLTSNGVNKFQSGRLMDFTLPRLSQGLSGSGKIYTQKDFTYIYILDAGNNRILILDKKGGLVKTLKSDKFTKLKDFAVDGKGKVIYVLNDGSLLKISL